MKPVPTPFDTLTALGRLAAALAGEDQPESAFTAAQEAFTTVVGAKLFTLMVLDEKAGEAIRIHSNMPDAYPVSGRKNLGRMTGWGEHVLGGRRAYIGHTAEDIEWAFFDHELIATLGCASVLNLPVLWDGAILGTVNLLHEAHYYSDADVALGQPFAQMLVPAYLKALERT